MTIQEIYKAFDAVGCCTFATVEDGYPQTRIAHFIAQDKEGLYFMTMVTKPFYRQLTREGKVSVCGMSVPPQVGQTPEGGLAFQPGYMIRMTGDVREVPMEKIRAKYNSVFDFCIADHERYPAMVPFVVYRGQGEIFDYDFAKEKRDHKLERTPFAFGGAESRTSALTINPGACIGCGKCKRACSFSAIHRSVGEKFQIDPMRCDVCGNCQQVCPRDAIH